MKQLQSFLLSLAGLSCIVAALVFGGFDWGKAMVDAHRLAGKWEFGASTVEFRTDGTLREVGPLFGSSGTFKLLPGNRMDLAMDGILWGTNKGVLRWALIDGTLCLGRDDGGSDYLFRCRRLKS